MLQLQDKNHGNDLSLVFVYEIEISYSGEFEVKQFKQCITVIFENSNFHHFVERLPFNGCFDAIGWVTGRMLWPVKHCSRYLQRFIFGDSTQLGVTRIKKVS